jgi:hypothetical protein
MNTTEPLHVFADLMDMETWEACMNDGWLIPSDGHGYFATDKVQWSKISCFNTAKRPVEATHVVWFNK